MPLLGIRSNEGYLKVALPPKKSLANLALMIQNMIHVTSFRLYEYVQSAHLSFVSISQMAIETYTYHRQSENH